MERPSVKASHAIFILALLMGAAQAADNPLPNGLELVKFEVRTATPARVGRTVVVEMVLKNVSNEPLRFDAEPGIFVAARWNSTSDANNRDFGHTKRALLLRPGASVPLRASTKLDAAGTWRFWPGFRLNGHWGPFRWMEKTLEVQAGPAAVQAGDNTLPNGLQLVKFQIRTATPARVGRTAVVEMVLKNVSNEPLRFDAEPGIFVAARWNSTSDANNRDFGHTKRALLLRPGASVPLRASTKLDAAGTWRFWPGFRLNGHWGPFRWMEKTLEVQAGPAGAR